MTDTANKQERQYCYSLSDEGLFDGRFDTEAEALEAAKEEALEEGHKPGTEITVYVGQLQEIKDLIQKMNKPHLGEYAVDQIEDWLCDYVAWDDQIIELEDFEGLGQAIIDFVREHAKFNCYNVAALPQEKKVVL